MKLLINEDMPQSSVDTLRHAGFDVKHATRKLSGAVDERMLELSLSENRTIISFDNELFKLALNNKKVPESGMISLDINNYGELEPAKLLVKLFKATKLEFKGTYTVVMDNFILQKKYR